MNVKRQQADKLTIYKDTKMILKTVEELLIPFDLEVYRQYKPQVKMDDTYNGVRIGTTKSRLPLKGIIHPITGVEYCGVSSMETPLFFTCEGVAFSNSPHKRRLMMRVVDTTEYVNISVDDKGHTTTFKYPDPEKAKKEAQNLIDKGLVKLLVIADKITIRSY